MKPSKGFDSLGNPIKEAEVPIVPPPYKQNVDEDDPISIIVKRAQQRVEAKPEPVAVSAPVLPAPPSELEQLKARIAQLERAQTETPKSTELQQVAVHPKHAKAKPIEKNLRIGLLFIGIMCIACFGIMVDLYIIEPQKIRDSYNKDPAPQTDNPCPPGQHWFNSDQVPDSVGGCY